MGEKGLQKKKTPSGICIPPVPIFSVGICVVYVTFHRPPASCVSVMGPCRCWENRKNAQLQAIC